MHDSKKLTMYNVPAKPATIFMDRYVIGKQALFFTS